MKTLLKWIGILSSLVIGAVIGEWLGQPYVFLRVLGGTLIGYLLSLIPRNLGLKRGNEKIAAQATILCTMAGAIGGAVFAMPTAALFIIVIMVKNPPSLKAS